MFHPALSRAAPLAAGPFLVSAGIANYTDKEAGVKYQFAPCVNIPTLYEPWKKTRAMLESFNLREQGELLTDVGR